MSTGGACILLLAAALIYFLPAITAFRRGVEHAVPIAGLNLMFGWTMLGWCGALVWACYSRPAMSEYEIVPRYLDGHVAGRPIPLPYPVITDTRIRFDPPPLRRI